MAWEKKGFGETVDLKQSKGFSVEGHYRGTRKINVKGQERTIHDFHDQETDKDFSVWGFTMLDRQINGTPSGVLVKLTYQGQERVQTKSFGLKDVHQVDVEIWREDSKPKDGAFPPEPSGQPFDDDTSS